MNKYAIDKTIGSGAFGEVYLATNVQSGAKVAIKKLFHKHDSWKTCLALPELRALQKLQKRRHENIVRVYVFVRASGVACVSAFRRFPVRALLPCLP